MTFTRERIPLTFHSPLQLNCSGLLCTNGQLILYTTIIKVEYYQHLTRELYTIWSIHGLQSSFY